MQEKDSGRAKSTSLSGNAEYDVEYSIVFTTGLRTVRRGFPPVTNFKAHVQYIKQVDGSSIPEGEYLLNRHQEINRVQIWASIADKS